METIKYKGRTTIVSDNLNIPIKETIDPPKKSHKFRDAVYYDGSHYFLDSNRVVFYSGKWREDQALISNELRLTLESV